MKRVLIAQLGAREHYRQAVMAYEAGNLARLITDLWNPWGDGLRRLATVVRSNRMAQFSGRHRSELPRRCITVLWATAFATWVRRWRIEGVKALYEDFIKEGQIFASECVRYI